MTQHYQSLRRMYLAAPINQLYLPEISIDKGEARISIELRESYHHAAGAVHGSVYFKMLDDAAYFAASSLEREFFLLTASFTTYLIRPVASGVMRATGRVVSRTRSQIIAESVVYDGRDRELARGSGIFAKSGQRLEGTPGYADPNAAS
ncbi:PaaI family thioesterase [Sedimenticola thiotaurini]|uniref:Thioesterase n=1 Tax=Sedimenticola thiotaurini TaxID=1543721 RepID=A0A0F7K1A7_9GAMM|nr:PaaI family thioesterase [Sedimenticola thiotaurini]AKH22346.1 thioesterase [Sedimenticola thiotaurini]